MKNKLTVTIDLEDVWSDSGDSLSDSLRNSIKHAVLHQLRAELKDIIEITVKEEVSAQFKQNLGTEVAMITREVVASGKVRPSSNSESAVTVKEWIIQQIEHRNSKLWDSPKKQLQAYAKKHIDEIKKQYDFMYASSVVQKMAELGMLKDDKVAELLTAKKD